MGSRSKIVSPFLFGEVNLIEQTLKGVMNSVLILAKHFIVSYSNGCNDELWALLTLFRLRVDNVCLCSGMKGGFLFLMQFFKALS